MKNKLLSLPISDSHVPHTNRLQGFSSFDFAIFSTARSGGCSRFSVLSRFGVDSTGLSPSQEDHDSILEITAPSINGRTMCQI
jgi:hypothetical protein